MNGKMVDGKALIVRPRTEGPGRGPMGGGGGGFNGPRFGPNEMDDSKLYVAHLGPDINEDVLSRVFGSFGQIMNIRIITDRETGQSKGYAFITFSEQVGSSHSFGEGDTCGGGQVGGGVQACAWRRRSRAVLTAGFPFFWNKV